MSRFIADQSSVVMKVESGTYAVASGNGVWVGIVNNHNIKDTTNVQSLRYLGTNDRNVDMQVAGPLDHEGTLSMFAQDFRMLVYALGSVADTGTGPYVHTISETNSNVGNPFTSGTKLPFISFTMEDAQKLSTGSNFVRTANGAIIDSLSLSASQGGFLSAEVTYVPQTVGFSSGAPTSATASTVRPFQWQDIKVHLPSGTVIDEVTDFDFSISNNLERPHYLNGSAVIGVPVPLNRDYELSLTLHSTSERTKPLYDQYFRGGSLFNVLLEFTDVSAGAGSRTAFISLSGNTIIDMEAPTPSEGVHSQTLVIQPKSASAVVTDAIAKYQHW